MALEGKTEAVKEWAAQWPDIDGYLKMNATDMESGEASMQTDYSTSVVNRFINGRCRREFLFALTMICDWSDGFDDVNAEANRLNESWVDWVNEQFPDNVPDWKDCTIESIESVYGAPALAQVDSEAALAKYQFQAKITYID